MWLALAATISAPRAAGAGIERKGNEWTLETGLVRKVIRLELASFRNLVSEHEYVSIAQPSPRSPAADPILQDPIITLSWPAGQN